MGEDWTTSSFSKNRGQCVQARTNGTSCDVRDSQHPASGHLEFTYSAWVNALATPLTQLPSSRCTN